MFPSGLAAAKRQGQQSCPKGSPVWLHPSLVKHPACVCVCVFYVGLCICMWHCSNISTFLPSPDPLLSCLYLGAFIKVWNGAKEGARCYFQTQVFFFLLNVRVGASSIKDCIGVCVKRGFGAEVSGCVCRSCIWVMGPRLDVEHFIKWREAITINLITPVFAVIISELANNRQCCQNCDLNALCSLIPPHVASCLQREEKV